MIFASFINFATVKILFFFVEDIHLQKVYAEGGCLAASKPKTVLNVTRFEVVSFCLEHQMVAQKDNIR